MNEQKQSSPVAVAAGSAPSCEQPRPELVLFDVDGTLIDSRPAILAAFRHAFRTVLGIDYPQAEEEIRLVFVPRMREVCATVAGLRADACIAAYERFYLEHCDTLVTAFPGAAETLTGLIDRGVAVGLVTNKGRERIGPDLYRASLDHIPLAVLVCTEDTPERKPHPAPLRLALKRAGCPPDAAIYVGDGPHDVLAAKACGLRAVGAAYGYFGADRLAEVAPEAIISEPQGLLRLIDTGVSR